MMPAVAEGTFFLLPVEPGQYGVGLVARAPRRGGVLLGYFFGPRRTRSPDVAWAESRTSAQAVLVARFRDQALYRGEWPIICQLSAFERRNWPVPAFHRFDGSVTLTPSTTPVTDWRVQYGDDNLITPIEELPATGSDLRLRADAVYDARTVAERVNAMLVAAVPSADDELWR
jgi:hypothetical protein